MNTMTDLARQLVLSQRDRLLRLDFPHGDGPVGVTLVVNSLAADEGLSRDFHYKVELLSDDAHIALTDVMGRMATVSLVRDDGTLRHFNGYVFAFRLVKTDGGFAFYDMVLRPWLAFLRLRHDCATFQQMTLSELTEETFGRLLERDYRLHLNRQERDITLAIQYNEFDYNHLHRRWESAGLLYWYEHRADGHTLVLADDSTQADVIDGIGTVVYRSESGTQEADGVGRWSPGRELASTLYTVSTYDFKNARGDRADRPSLDQQGAVPELERHEYTGAYGFTDADGEALAQRRMEQTDADAYQFDAVSNHRSVQPGRKFSLVGHFGNLPGGQEGDYLVLSVHHEATNNYQADGASGSRYTNRFTCVRHTVPWRPGRGHNSVDTRIFGVQTATVVGPKGEEIYTDEYGRVRVQFHWDREGRFDEKSSPWVRVMTTWAGSNFGHVSLPRIGQEVIVQFLDGHTDRPLIVGSVYNAANMPPWDLPANRTQSGMLSRSTPSGGPDNANALRFEDRKGAEEVWLHAERDQRIEVEHDESHSVGQDRRKIIGRDEVVEVKRNRTETVDGDETIAVRGNRRETVGKDELIKVDGHRTEVVGMDERVTIHGAKTESVGKSKVESVAHRKALKVGEIYSVNVGAAMNTAVAASQTAEIGTNKLTTVGERYVIEAGSSLSITVGAATLSMSSDGTIALSGTSISISGSGPVRINGKDVDIN